MTESFNEQVEKERARQIAKGYTSEHDDEHGYEHLLSVAQFYENKNEDVKAVATYKADLELVARQEKREELARQRKALERDLNAMDKRVPANRAERRAVARRLRKKGR